MKKNFTLKIKIKYQFLLIVNFLIYSHAAIAQQEFAPIGAEWFFTHTNHYTFSGYSHYSVEKDTLIQGKDCRKITIFCEGRMHMPAPATNKTYYIEPVFVYEENNVIYIYNNGNNFDTLANFNAVAGDQWFLNNQSCDEPRLVTVQDTGSSIVNGKSLKWLLIDFQRSSNQTEPDTFYQTIGSVNFSFNPYDYCEDELMHGAQSLQLRCYSDNNYSHKRNQEVCDYYITSVKTNHSAGAKISIFPNPAIDKINIEIESKLTKPGFVQVFSLDGRKVLEQAFFNQGFSVNIPDLFPGIYLLQISHNDKLEVKKFIKK